jgi:hypothetical protein
VTTNHNISERQSTIQKDEGKYHICSGSSNCCQERHHGRHHNHCSNDWNITVKATTTASATKSRRRKVEHASTVLAAAAAILADLKNKRMQALQKVHQLLWKASTTHLWC